MSVPGGAADDLVPKRYWEALWERRRIPRPADPTGNRVRNHMYRQFDDYLRRVLTSETVPGPPRRLLEAGCAGSRWLPYFERRFGYDVVGIDYSRQGCAQAQEVLRTAGGAGHVVCADFTMPPPKMRDSFQVVFSFGLVEHFRDTAGAVRHLAKFLSPGGTMVTVVPNMTGLLGAAMRYLNRPLFEQHVQLTDVLLAEAHKAAGLELVSAQWLGASNFAVVNLTGLESGTVIWWMKRAIMMGLIGVTVAIWALEELGLPITPTQRCAPYVVVAARRPRLGHPGPEESDAGVIGHRIVSNPEQG